MKLDKNKIQISIGKNPSKTFYKLQLLLKDHFPENLKTKFSFQTASGIFTGENGQIFTDEVEKIIYLGLGETSKIKSGESHNIFFNLERNLKSGKVWV